MASSLPKIARAMERWSCETVCEVAVGIVENAGPSCYNIDDSLAVCVVRAADLGRLAQLVRALPSHGRGQRFKSFVAHHPSSNFILAENLDVNLPAYCGVAMSAGSVLSRRPMRTRFARGVALEVRPLQRCPRRRLAVAAASRRVYNAQLEGSYVHCVADD